MYIEFYITNICNLDCSDCRSFNNFDFTGHYEFDFDLYRSWADKINLTSYVLLGGEPLLHPNFKSWVEGTRKLWPNAWAKIDTNGTQIGRIKNLHQLLVDNEYFLCVNIHNPSKLYSILQNISDEFGECELINEDDPRIYYNGRFQNTGRHMIEYSVWLITQAGLPIQIRSAWNFDKAISSSTNWKNLLSPTPDKNSIYIGNAQTSHNSCSSSKCHIMLDGKIYKCSTVATLPVFLKQKKLNWPNDTIFQYEPITIDNFSETNYKSLQNTIPQCAFCPTGTHDLVSVSSANVKRKGNRVIPILTDF